MSQTSLLRQILYAVCAMLVVGRAGIHAADGLPVYQVPEEIERDLLFYARQTERQPSLYPAWALRAKGYLQRARWSGDVADVDAARRCVEQSLRIQSNLPAFLVAGAVSNYRHRFEETLVWCDRAAAAAPGHPEVLVQRTEALLALGRHEEAWQGVLAQEKLRRDANTFACRGQCLIQRGDRAAGLEALRESADQAQRAGLDSLAIWALVTAAGACLDAGQPDEAAPYLAAAAKQDADNVDLWIHLAELDIARGTRAAALDRYQRVLRRQRSPEVYRRCYVLQQELGMDGADAFRQAETLWRLALSSGEVYPLEGLANLYCDASVRLGDAVRLAEKNLEHKRDMAAQATLDRAKRLWNTSAHRESRSK